MAETTGIAWTNGTVNFWIGCTHAGPGCEGCYAEVFAERKFNLKFGPGEKRHKTQAGYENPLRWQRMHEKAAFADKPATMVVNGSTVPAPVWVFANSLSDFFDNEIDPSWRTEAWDIIRRCPSLRWQIVTKRVGNVAKMLPADWHDGKNYRNVGIIATMVTQEEMLRDMPKLRALKVDYGVHWIGASIEPQLGPIRFSGYANGLDWIICGGESKQGNHEARAFYLDWGRDLRDECSIFDVPFFMKQLGDHPVQFGGRATKFGQAGSDPSKWPEDLRVQQMPRIYDREPDTRVVKDLFE